MENMTSTQLAQLLYVAYYGRPADASGLTFWAEQIDAVGVEGVAADFGASAEFEARFGDLTNEELVQNLYQQLFGRDGEQAGVDYWVNLLENGTPLAQIALEIANGAQNADITAINNKVAVAQRFTEAAGDDYAGDDAANIARDFLLTVNADTDAETADVEGALDSVADLTTFTLAEAQAAEALPAKYTIEDSAANLVAAASAAAITTLANAEAIVVAGDATVEQMNALINVSEYSNIESYTLNDTVENLLAGGDIVANAASATVAGEPVLTVAQYNEIAAVATVETYTVVDTAEAILEAGADAAALANAGSVAITDEAVTLEQAVALDALSLDVAYPAVDVSLEAAAAADTLPANYALTADVFAAGEVTVEEAAAAFGAVSAIVEGAANAEELAVADLFTWSVADTLENIEAADAAVIEGADAYTLTNEAGDLGELTGDQYELVLGAANADDYTYTVVPSPITGISAEGPVVEGNDIAFTVEMDYAVNVERVISYQIEGATTGTAGAADALADLGQITGTVTIPAGETTGTITLTPLEDGTTEGREAFTVSLLNDDGTEVVATSNVVVIEDNANAGQNVALTTGIDEFTGGAGNDTFTGNYTGVAATNTITTLDSIDGAGGRDVFRINDISNAFNFNNDVSNVNIENIEEIRVRSANDFTLNSTNIAGVELLNVVQAGNVNLTAADTTAINVEGVESNGTQEVFTATFVGTEVGGDTTVDFDGVQVTLGANTGGADIAGDFVAKYNADGSGTYTAVDNNDGTVTFTAKDAGNKTDVDATDFVFNDAGSDNTTTVEVTTVNVGTQGSNGDITLDGGSTQDVVADNQVNVTADNAAGAINVTHENQGTGNIAITDGTDVTVTASSEVATGNITVGTAGNEASGAVSVTQNLTSEGDVLDNSGAAINVTGGTTVDVTVNGTITADEATDNGNALTAGDVTVASDGNTTDVTVVQNLVDNDKALEVNSAATTETAAITFGALKAGEQVAVSNGALDALGTDLTFTAAKDLTAEEVAAAFAELTNADTQATGGTVENGVFTGTLDAGWISGAANGDTVTFSSTTAGAIGTDLVVTAKKAGGITDVDNVADFDVAVTQGVAANTVAAANVSTIYGNVRVDGNAAASIANVTVDGYSSADLGTTGVDLNALETLSLANSAGVATVNTAAAALDMTVNNVNDNVTFTAANLTDLDIVTTEADSTFQLTAAAVTDLNVSGDRSLNLAGSTLTALNNVVVAGAASLNLGLVEAAESINTTATTGTVTTQIDGTEATYTGGEGVDNLTLVTGTALDKAIDLGAGNDTVTFGAAVTGSSAALNGGDGIDTLSMAVANAAALDNSAQNFYTNFERLVLNDKVDLGTANVTIDLANLGFTNYVTTSGTDDTDAGADNTLILDKMESGGTVVLTGSMDSNSAGIQVNVADADTNAADVLNVVVTTATTDLDAGTLTVADVETVNITSIDSQLDNDSDGVNDPVETNTLDLNADSATSVVVDGNANLVLDVADSADVTTIDAGALTGALTVTATGNAAMTVNGGSGADHLTAAGNGDVLNGGAGNDTLTGANLSQLTGGEGADTFMMNKPSNVNSYSTITDLEAGDVIDLDSANVGTVEFSSSAVELAGTAVFQDYANEAVNLLGSDTNDAAWFQFDGNTYIVQSGGDHSTGGTPDFQNGQDSIIQITGLVDLSTASYNQTNGTLEIA